MPINSQIQQLQNALQQAEESVRALQAELGRSPEIDPKDIQAIAPMVESSEILAAQICGLFAQMSQFQTP
ncbi:hypothetical protein [Thermoleptolyngbya sp. M55_K2018_002]|uniref:hypothetical protein n=1 Tax=Thermoleptolyngbya sp. M55_K2018_002 TaxID=2747808 RepID=UPI0019F761A6|nr:hypothetical protein [Thermoleptolyngbya sp. M55_K2018_002]HIK39774.1 hypothetical protein [Thermoleptolyngbya sp. M55_K2018_002]